MRIFRPNLTYQSFLDIDIKLLLEKNVKTLLIDLDNTLVAHDVSLPTKEVFDFINKVKNNNINIIIISNNTKERVELFVKELDVPYYHFACKPSKITYKKIIKELNPSLKIACVGDQILTDVLGGNRMKFITIYTKPLFKKDLSFTKINRIFEKMILNNLEKNNKLNIGEYYE